MSKAITKWNYNDVKNSIFPQKQLIKYFVAYYGEEYREIITQKIKKQELVISAEDIPAFQISALFKAKYQHDESVKWEERAEIFKLNLDALLTNSDLFSPLILGRDADILTDLGFDIRKILIKDDVGLTSIAPTEETERLKEYFKQTHLGVEDIDVGVSAKQIIEIYNKFAQEKKSFEFYGNRMFSKTIFLGTTLTITRNYPENVEYPTIDLKSLTKDNVALFLEEIMKAKGPIAMWNDEFAKYAIKGLNELFNKNFTSVQDILKDPSMKIFIDLQQDIYKRLEIVHKQEAFKDFHKNGKKTYVGDELYNYANEYFFENLNAAAVYASNSINIRLRSTTSLNEIMHETNHALSSDESTQRIGFHSKGSGCGFNEIVNEFLTGRIMANIPQEDLDSLPIRDDSSCSYRPAIKIMQRFLIKFEKILKESQMKSPEVLKQFIGEQNYILLISLGQDLADVYLYGNAIIEIDKNRKISAADWLEFHKANPNYEYNVSKGEKHFLEKLLTMSKFLNDMCERYEAFENGNKSAVKVQKQVILNSDIGAEIG